jgi:hypothetical protein
MEARNRARWSESPEIRAWLESSRLDAYTGLIARVAAQPNEAQAAAIARYRRAARTGYTSMQALLESA